MTIALFHVDAFTDHPFAGNPTAVCLLPSWKEARWLQAVAREMNLSEFAAFQVSARGGVVKVRVVKDRVFLGGRAVTVAKGELSVEGEGS